MKKQNAKKIMAFLLAIAMCAGATGCASKSEEEKIEDALGSITEEDINKIGEELEGAAGSAWDEEEDNALEKIEIDPFEDITVTFEGIYPDSKVSVSSGNSSVNYKADKETGVKNGDTVKVTAELTAGAVDQGIVLAETEKEFTVEGIAAYASELAEIPDDMLEKMQKQADDAITADAASWDESAKLKDSKFIGYYFLSVKDGFSASPNNKLLFVYKNTATLTGVKRDGDVYNEVKETGDETYYIVYSYSDIIFMPDGTCSVDLSNGSLTENTYESDYGYVNMLYEWCGFWNNGYKDIDSLFSNEIAANIDKYSYESTVSE